MKSDLYQLKLFIVSFLMGDSTIIIMGSLRQLNKLNEKSAPSNISCIFCKPITSIRQGRIYIDLSNSADHSVHWEKDQEGQLVPQPGDHDEGGSREHLLLDSKMEGFQAPGDAMETVNDVQKRVLDQWCFAEHMEPQVLQQVGALCWLV